MIIKVLKILIVINLFVWQFQIGSNNLKLYFLDIGQGDSTLVVTPDNFTILIDGGPDNSVLSKLSEVLPFYINKLNLVILTHPDKDHVGGLADVSKNFDIEYVMYTDSTGKSYEYEMFMDNVKAVKNLNFNDDLRIGCCTYLHMLWPNNTDIKYLEPNDGSISFELIYKNFNVYFAGDLSKLYEEKIVNADSFLDVDILKVSHHGSKTSTSRYFVQKINPELAIIPVGRNNKFGHPHKEVVQALQTENIKYLRTDELGTIKIESDGSNFYY